MLNFVLFFMYEQLLPILQQFKIIEDSQTITPIEVGHINKTYRVTTRNGAYILQKINTQIFQAPLEVMQNINRVGQFLRQKKYPKKILLPIATKKGLLCLEDVKNGHWRLFPFIENTTTFNEVDSPQKAYQAAYAFGEYAYYLKDFDGEKLVETIPNFHDTLLRFGQFLGEANRAGKARLASARGEITDLTNYRYLLYTIHRVQLPQIFVHNYTKINNILFYKTTHLPVCVIDLDTLMSGTILYDFGDMVRTFTPTQDENSADFDQIFVRAAILRAVTKGYVEGWRGKLSKLEIELLPYGAQLTIFEQALRFLTDYLAGDIYYKVQYNNQNLVRAKNQIRLLDELTKMYAIDSR
ncbi:MAG: aminoglycoside phosphotransferase family protein [Bacteroidota bacterium]